MRAHDLRWWFSLARAFANMVAHSKYIYTITPPIALTSYANYIIQTSHHPHQRHPNRVSTRPTRADLCTELHKAHHGCNAPGRRSQCHTRRAKCKRCCARARHEVIRGRHTASTTTIPSDAHARAYNDDDVSVIHDLDP